MSAGYFGQKRMACVGGVYSVAPFHRTAEEVVDGHAGDPDRPHTTYLVVSYVEDFWPIDHSDSPFSGLDR